MNESAGADTVRFFALGDGEGFSPLEGIDMRAVYGRGASLNVVTLEPDAELPLHTHPHEQIGIVLEGVQILMVGGRHYHLEPQQAYVVPSGVEHGGIGGPEGCVVLDIFVPPREEYRDAAVPESTVTGEPPR